MIGNAARGSMPSKLKMIKLIEGGVHASIMRYTLNRSN